jgi:hypothetical protein
VGEYFSDASMIKIDIFDVNKSISVIERAINDEIFERSQVALQQSRELMIEKYHPYRVYTKIFESLPPSAPSKVVIRPQNEFRYSMRQRVYSRLGLLGVS